MRRSPDAKATDIRLLRQAHKGSFLVVEGADDERFFRHLVDEGACYAIAVDGKDDVCEVVKILETDAFEGVVGVVDADLDHMEGRGRSSDNLIVLETVDLEALLIRSAALDRVLVELGSPKKIARFEKDVRLALVEAGSRIGCLRLHSLRAELGLKFKGIKYSGCIDKRSLEVSIEDLVQQVLNRSQRHELVQEDVEHAVVAIHSSLEDQWLVAYGKDMVEVLSYGLRGALGTRDAREVVPEVLRRSLRLAFRWRDLKECRLWADLSDWEARNRGFRVLEQRS